MLQFLIEPFKEWTSFLIFYITIQSWKLTKTLYVKKSFNILNWLTNIILRTYSIKVHYKEIFMISVWEILSTTFKILNLLYQWYSLFTRGYLTSLK